MFDKVLFVFMVLSPIFNIVINNARLNGIFVGLQYNQFGTLSLASNAVQLQFFQYMVIALLAGTFFSKQKRFLTDWSVGILFILTCVSFVIHNSTLPLFVPVLLGFLLYKTVVSSTRNMKIVLWAVFVVASLNTVFSVLQFFDIHLLYKPHGVHGLMMIKNHLGVYQALAIPLCYALNPWLAIIPVIGLVLAKSSTGAIAAIIGILYVMRERIPKGIMTVWISVSVIAFLFIKHFRWFVIRLPAWQEVFRTRSWFGHGIGTFEMTVPDVGRYDMAYGIYQDAIYAVGIISVIFIFKFIKDNVRFYNDRIANGICGSCIILFVCGLTQSFMSFPRLAGTAIVLFALLRIVKEESYGVSTVTV